MHAFRAATALFFFTILSTANLRATPADDAVAALLKLRAEPGYSWEVSTSKPGYMAPVPPRTKHGWMMAGGVMMLECIWADGRIVEMIVRPDGAAVVNTTSGWKTKKELSDLVRRRGPETSRLRLALDSLEPMSPEEELTHLLNDAKSYERTGDTIDAVLTERGASFWLGSARQIPDAAGTLHLRLRDGLIRECHISAASENASVAFDCTYTFGYSTPPSIPAEAKQKLDDASASGR